ncbi:monooxygenase [Solwaraspora sp. WMMA2080]|uniref:monooxygenase n=1 Tax=unclassified Solwaraspora TaxID=2627926 RepID=UPI00248C3992|nr:MULTISPECIES: monooxygenase [unclassified Solwaraspora]WBB95083.1 monooxygenase [Solwaraspora sp. WMMA2059]WBC21033.1 monooxygenase [Solwaraspora sp. WMMA2080]
MNDPVGRTAPVPELVTLHVWRVPRRRLPRVLARMAVDARRLRRVDGVRFAKLLGTGTGTGFGPTDVDPTRWAALVVWDDPATATGFDTSPVGQAWLRIADARVRVDLRPLHSRGRWSGITPFGGPGGGPGGGQPGAGRPVLALTRARLRPAKAVTFWRAVPPVAAALADADGLRCRFGVGEAPLGWQGTVSVWRDTADLTRFAYRHPQHRAAITRTPVTQWYAEELFARFEVLGVAGDRAVLGWAGEDEDGTCGAGGG